MRTQPPGALASGQPEPLKGVRRNMARVMADAHAKVVPTTLNDDADMQAWSPGNDLTARLVRALVSACKAVPAMNAWFDGGTLTRTLHPHVDVGIAVDTDDGLFVPAWRNADLLVAARISVTERLVCVNSITPKGVRYSPLRPVVMIVIRSIGTCEIAPYSESMDSRLM